MRTIPIIRYGTGGYPENVARRRRAVNLTASIAAATHAFYAVVTLVDETQPRWLTVGNLSAMALYAGASLLHRFGRLAGPIAVVTLFYVDMLAFAWLLGTDSGVPFYFLLGAAIAGVYFGPEYLALTAAVSAIAAALIIGVMLTVPHDTGMLPAVLMVVRLVTNSIVSCAGLLLVVSYALREVARAEAASDELLRNILPAKVADRLKRRDGVVIADRYDEASVLFADMAGFTARASDTDPGELVQFLNRVFTDFDRLVDEHALEKIQTTGDSYMVVSGVPVPRPDHAAALARLALAMRDSVADLRDPHGRNVPIRIGVSCGAVVAGVVGTSKFFYDVWGDAVNVAARMETAGAGGQIHVSEAAYVRLRDEFALESRGATDIKGKGSMPTWFLVGHKAAVT